MYLLPILAFFVAQARLECIVYCFHALLLIESGLDMGCFISTFENINPNIFISGITRDACSRVSIYPAESFLAEGVLIQRRGIKLYVVRLHAVNASNG